MHNTQNTKQYVFLEGGLGNQLYMIAYANYLKEQGYAEVELITRPVKKKKGDTNDKTKRWLLTELPNLLGIKLLFFWHRYIFSFLARLPKLPFYKLFFSSIFAVHQEPFRKWHIFMPTITGVARYNLHIGYFQSYKYISEDFLKRASKAIEALAPKKQNFNISRQDVAVHIRRGDFFTNGNEAIFKRIECSYYLKGLAYISERQKINKVYIFSDDFQAIEADIQEIKKHYTVEVVSGQTVLDDMNTLQKFNNFVIGNSTFSWWGAMLASAEGKTVVVPKTTLAFEMPGATAFPPDWVLLEN